MTNLCIPSSSWVPQWLPWFLLILIYVGYNNSTAFTLPLLLHLLSPSPLFPPFIIIFLSPDFPSSDSERLEAIHRPSPTRFGILIYLVLSLSFSFHSFSSLLSHICFNLTCFIALSSAAHLWLFNNTIRFPYDLGTYLFLHLSCVWFVGFSLPSLCRPFSTSPIFCRI